MKLEFIYKIIVIMLLILSGKPMVAQFSLKKTLSDSIIVNDDGQLLVENKYGNIEVMGWERNTVKIEFWIEIIRDEISDAENLINRIVPSISNYGDYIVAKTEIGKSERGFFKKMLSELNIDNDESGIEIQLKVYLPKELDLDISNEFGDVILLDWSGKLKCKLKHGDLIVRSKINSIDLEQSYGKINLNEAGSAELDVRNVTLKANKIDKLGIESHGSDFEISEVDNLTIASNKDEYKISKVNSFKGNLKYGSANLDTLTKGITVKLKVSDLQITKIIEKNANIFVNQHNSDVDINVKDFDFKLHATLEQGTFRIPKDINDINKEVLSEKENKRIVTGSYGLGDSGSITIEGKKGFVVLREL